jgi:hypothetical protein
MDKRITFRFYDVDRAEHSHFNFDAALMEIANIPRPRDREASLGEDFDVRAEIISRQKGAIVGEMSRIQRTDLPSEIQDDRRIPLQTQNPLGHGVVFRYLPGNRRLGIQYDPRRLSPGRFIAYVGRMLEGAIFDIRPVVRQDVWDRFQQTPVRKVSISIAGPDDLARLDRGPAASVVSSMKSMAEAYEAPKINIEMSMGHRRDGSLSERIKGAVAFFRGRAIHDGGGAVVSLKAKIKEEGERSEEINLLDDILAVKEVLQLDS